MPLRVKLTLDPDGAICLESPYDRALVEGLKAAVDWSGRAWDATRKRWIVSPLYADDLVQYLTSAGCLIHDARGTALSGGTGPPPPPMPLDLKAAFDVLYLQYTAPLCVAVGAYKALSKYFHPDRGGDPGLFHAVNDAIQVVRRYLDPKPDDCTDADIPF